MSNQYLKLRRSGVPGKIPTTESIDFGEIALNTYDGLAFMKRSGSNGEEVVPIGSPSGSFFGDFTGTFTGSLQGTASWANNAITASYALNVPTIDLSGYTTTSSFNAFTASYYQDSSSFDQRINNISFDSSSLVTTSSFNAFTSSYNTGSFTGSFTGSLQGTASNIEGGIQYYLPVWTGATTLGTSSLYDDGSVLKSVYSGSDIGLKLDFVNGDYRFGDLSTNPTGNYLYIDNQYIGTSNVFNGNEGIILDFVNRNYLIGDPGNLNGNALIIDDTNETIRTINQGNDIGLKLDFNNGEYYLGDFLNGRGAGNIGASSFVGDINNLSNGTFLNVEPDRIITYYSNNANGLFFDFANALYSIGDINNTSGSTKIVIDDNAQTITLSGSLNAPSITGSLHGTASWANNAITASYALNVPETASYALQALSSSFAETSSYALTASYVEGLFGTGSNTVQYFTTPSSTWTFNHNLNNKNVIIQTYDSNDNQIIPQNIQLLNTNTAIITFPTLETGYAIATIGGGNVINISGSSIGSFATTGSNIFIGTQIITGSININGGVTGSLQGTASWAENAITASYILNAVSSSFASTASFTTTSITASYSDNFIVQSTLILDQTITDFASIASTTVGTNNLFTQPTGSYTSAFGKYTLYNGVNSRAGEFVTSWIGNNITFYDNSTTDNGSTSDISFTSTIVAGNIQIRAVALSSGWTVKMLTTFI